jgi:hypothetical protein
MTRYPILSALCLAGVSALLLPISVLGEETSPPPAAAAPSDTASAIADLEARSPQDFNNPALIVEINAAVMRLVETNRLNTGEDFFRAAMLLGKHMGEYRTGRVHYELMLAAAARGHPAAEASLASSWDTLLSLIGRPLRIDAFNQATTNPEFSAVDPAPACIQAVLRDPAGARTKAATASDNLEILTIKEADQAARQTDWNTLTEEQRKANMDGDRQRNARIRDIVAAGDVRTANDFARASLVMQHSARFPGYQLAHELAVCSLLLGDRQTGRWLVAASYDRMLGSVGLDQRFGTQYGAGGLKRVDEAGICDAQRKALGCPTLAEARVRQLGGVRRVALPVSQFLGANGSFRDEAKGVTATIPSGWTASNVTPAGELANSIAFRVADHPGASPRFYYRIKEPAPPKTADAAEAFLRDQAKTKETDRQTRIPDYRNRPNSFVFRDLNGQPSLSWIADYTQDGQAHVEYLTRILGPSSVGLLFLQIPAGELEALRPAVDEMAATVRLP